MKVILIASTPCAETVAGMAAATCTASDRPASSLKHSLDMGHESVIEHASFTFMIEGVSRVTLAQLTRHRLASFSVESQRYVDQSMNGYVVPPSIQANKKALTHYTELVNGMQVAYEYLIGQCDIDQQDARYLLPEAMQTNIVMTMNARQLKHLFAMRCCNRSQWEIRDMADEMLKIVKEICPMLFKDAGPGCVRGKCPEGVKCCGKSRKDEVLFK